VIFSSPSAAEEKKKNLERTTAKKYLQDESLALEKMVKLPTRQ